MAAAKRKRSTKGKPSRRKVQGKAKGGQAAVRLELDHLFIGASDFRAAWTFWTDTVGAEGLASWGDPTYAGSVRLGEGSVTVAAGEEGPYEELAYTVRHGRPQVFLKTPDLAGLHKRMVQKGANVLAGPLTTHWGARCFSAEGPDGLVVVFVEGK